MRFTSGFHWKKVLQKTQNKNKASGNKTEKCQVCFWVKKARATPTLLILSSLVFSRFFLPPPLSLLFLVVDYAIFLALSFAILITLSICPTWHHNNNHEHKCFLSQKPSTSSSPCIFDIFSAFGIVFASIIHSQNSSTL